MAKISAFERQERIAAITQGAYSLEGLADELNSRKFTRWSYEAKPGQDIFNLECGVKITCYKTSGSVLVQGRLPASMKRTCLAHLTQMLPSYTSWQVN